MAIWEYWEKQREQLLPLIDKQTDLSGVIYQVRHAMIQAEQNALAQMTDDVLRQQAGVLMSGIKHSVALMDTPVAAQVWVAQKQERASQRVSPLMFASLVLFFLICAWCALRSQWLMLMLLLVSCALLISGYGQERRRNSRTQVQEESRVTLKPDASKLLSILDSQIKAVDRHINDFAFLNEQLRASSEYSDPAAVARAADLLEALYECDESQRAPADDAAKKLLESLGLQAIDYSEETSRLFNALPTKNETRTLTPAIVSTKEQRLLRRGTAAVHIGAA